MRIAHLILAHKAPAQIVRLLQALAHPGAHCYIHLDKKTDAAPFAFLQALPNVHFTTTRLDVKWGGYSLTKVVLECSREILAQEVAYDFINVLSAQDYPLQPAEQMHRFYEQHLGLSFLECEPMGSAWWQENTSRYTHYHFTEVVFPGRYTVQNILKKLLPKRKFPLPYTLYGGNMGGWYTLSRDCAEYLLSFLDAEPGLRRFAHFTWGSDEFLIHTILLNSPLKHTIVNNNLRYIDWSEGGHSPKVLTQADFEALRTSNKLFARKFDIQTDANVLDLIDEHLLVAPLQSAS